MSVFNVSDHLCFINRIAVANADLALERGEVDCALNILRMIGPEQIYFIQVCNLDRHSISQKILSIREGKLKIV